MEHGNIIIMGGVRVPTYCNRVVVFSQDAAPHYYIMSEFYKETKTKATSTNQLRDVLQEREGTSLNY